MVSSYTTADLDDLIIHFGYKSDPILLRQQVLQITVHLGEYRIDFHGNPTDCWTVRLLDTDLDGDRMSRFAPCIGNQTLSSLRRWQDDVDKAMARLSVHVGLVPP
ncbi:hypothetical protein MTX26_26625 [Bradyrhizobium sp. ISRA443]|uniref:hypothetical protein n=1 Tax=unclassified Bradyrhizobium TaxID=2631580 RepID=UPI00247A29F9|nr:MULTISPECIES: hypothetical protein [unclassified Bradyrhizobium]WGR97910.1 hypothetical protein MTX23_26620 [Bradyrhizobium sp. ISRA436]WGS04800.1 hypothetical protein MTX18_26630 [Bradyrhizobium sp. ISRA437]WGS11680.1 hypothetical protein MTX26_26625 [Bradyrhizobium sp. ISRA443]